MKRYYEEFVIFSICVLLAGAFISHGAGNVGQVCCLVSVGLGIYWHKLEFCHDLRKIYIVMIAWVVAVFCSCLYAPEAFDSVRQWFNRWIWSSLSIFLVSGLHFSKKWNRIILGLFVVIMIIFSGLVAYEGITTHQRAGAIVNMQIMRVGSIFSVTLPLLLVMFFDERIFGNNRWWILPAVVIGNTGLLYNQTRGAWITCGLMYILILALYARRNKRITMWVLGCGLIAGVILFCSPSITHRWTLDPAHSSNSSRIRIWTAAYNIWKDNPVLGAGYTSFTDLYQKKYILPTASREEHELRHAHNNYMMVLAEQGAVGLYFYLFCYLSFVYYGVREYRKYRDPYSLMLACIFLAELIHVMTECTLHSPTLLRIYWTLVGTMISMHLQWKSDFLINSDIVRTEILDYEKL